MWFRIVFLMFGLFILVYPQKEINKTQEANTNIQVRPFTDIKYEISAPAQRALLLQPIPLVIRQKNITDEKVLGYKTVGFNSMPIYLHIKKNGSDQNLVLGEFSQIFQFIAYSNIEILPNTVTETKDWIWLGLNKFFPEAGTYEIKAVIFNKDYTSSVESNIVTIEIQQPTGVDRNVYNLIKNSGFQDYLFSGDEFDKKKNVLETIISAFPNNSYTKGATFVLGERYIIRKQYAQALIHLSRLENDADFVFVDKVRSYLSEIRRLPQTQTENR